MRLQLGRFGWRFWALLLACVVLAASFIKPTLPLRAGMHRYLLVLDITQSMNARDYHVKGMPADRLGFVKEAIRRFLEDLPCGNEIGLGLFTTQHTQVLFEPLELCEHYAVIDDVLAHIDWRMAWAADSDIDHGLFAGIRALNERDANTRLAFFTDGQQYPENRAPAYFHGSPGQVKGVIIGVGGAAPVPIPKLDRENRPQGYWEYADLQNYAPSAASPQGRSHDTQYYLSRLDEPHLQELAALTGLAYHRLRSVEALSKALLRPELAQVRVIQADTRRPAGLLGLIALLATTLGWLPRANRTRNGWGR